MYTEFLRSVATRPFEGLAYKIKNTQGITAGYLIGALHIRTASSDSLDEKILRCFAKTRELVVEMVPTEMRNNMDQYIRDREPACLRGVDFILTRLALRNGLEIQELETPEFQYELLKKTFGENWPEVTRKIIQNPDSIKPLETAWKSGNEEELIKMRKAASPEIFSKRDAPMSEKIDKRLQTSGPRICITVGAIHLVGEDGIAARLRDLGYSVEQIKQVKRPYYKTVSRIWKILVNQWPHLRISH